MGGINKETIQNNLIQILQYTFLILLVIGNVIGIIYAFSIYNELINVDTSNVTADQTKLVPVFNEALYKEIQKDRQTRSLYNSSSQVPKTNLNEVFSF